MEHVIISLPPDAIVCAPGDYLVCRQPEQGWLLYQVEDLVLVKRLVPLADPPGSLMLEEHMLDSMAPAYFNDVHLIVTAFDQVFAAEQDATRAIQRQELFAQSRGLLRPASDFSRSSCRVIRRSATSAAI